MKYDILIANEKHGDRYFDISTHTKFDLVCRKLLKEKIDEGLLSMSEVVKDDAPFLTEDEINKLPEHLQFGERERCRKILVNQAYYQKKVKRLEDLNKCLNSPVETELLLNHLYPLSFDFLKYYSDGEYDDIEIEQFESV